MIPLLVLRMIVSLVLLALSLKNKGTQTVRIETGDERRPLCFSQIQFFSWRADFSRIPVRDHYWCIQKKGFPPAEEVFIRTAGIILEGVQGIYYGDFSKNGTLPGEKRDPLAETAEYYVRNIAASMVIEFYETLMREATTEKGFFTAAGSFTHEARKFAAEKPIILIEDDRLRDFARIVESMVAAEERHISMKVLPLSVRLAAR
jgi:hypothetical protein